MLKLFVDNLVIDKRVSTIQLIFSIVTKSILVFNQVHKPYQIHTLDRDTLVN
jgi:hypothetical protein